MRWWHRLRKQYPAEYPEQAAWTVRLVPLSESVVRQRSPISHSALSARVALVLLISCVNVRQSPACQGQRAKP